MAQIRFIAAERDTVIYYLAARRHIVNVLTSNITFLIFAVLVV